MYGAHACLVPVNYATTNVFNQLEEKHKAARRTRACDYRHLMLLLSEELIGVTNVFLRWYKLFRQTTPHDTFLKQGGVSALL